MHFPHDPLSKRSAQGSAQVTLQCMTSDPPASYLCVFEGVHDKDGEAQSEDVGQETGVEIRPAVFLQAAGRKTV